MKGREMDDPEQKSFQLEGDEEHDWEDSGEKKKHLGISLCFSFWNFRSRNLFALISSPCHILLGQAGLGMRGMREV